jgi:tRNA threonylcarbamoyl adenosine modification protein YeaZ
MGYLAINTASFLSQIALVNKEKILDEKKWKSENNESERLMPEIQKLLEKNGVKFEDIEKVVVITGPGPFTALRVSIALINALAYGLNKPVIGISVIDYWKMLFKGNFVLNAGGNRVYYKGEIIDFDDFLKVDFKNKEISGEIKEDQIQKLNDSGFKWIKQEDLASFGNIILDLAKKGFEGYYEKEIAAPLYFSAPQITKSTKSYK